MKREDFEKLGDKHKSFEVLTDIKLMKGLPIIIRLDGRAFHTFTKGLKRPYDLDLAQSMIETTKHLVHHLSADVGYTQSDEITLGFKNEDIDESTLFSSRIQKLCSIAAAVASVKFNEEIRKRLPNKAALMPVFDSRVFQYPNLALAAESFQWRELDATRNSLTMLCHAHFKQSELHKAGYKKKHDLLHSIGLNWNDCPDHFKRGAYFGKKAVIKILSDEILAKIPEQYRPTGPVLRTEVCALELPILSSIVNKEEVLFFGRNAIRN